MRIPFYIVIPICLLGVGFVWWLGVKDMDFMTPPSEEKLRQIRESIFHSLFYEEKASTNEDEEATYIQDID